VNLTDYALYASGLIHVFIPGSVTNIGDNAIGGPVDAVVFSGNAPVLRSDSITQTGGNIPHVYYVPGTAGWGSNVDGFPLITWDPQSSLGYVVTNGTVTITRYLGTNSTVMIPSTINGLSVTAIDTALWAYYWGVRGQQPGGQHYSPAQRYAYRR
jgi:hypothetical protein